MTGLRALLCALAICAGVSNALNRASFADSATAGTSSGGSISSAAASVSRVAQISTPVQSRPSVTEPEPSAGPTRVDAQNRQEPTPSPTEAEFVLPENQIWSWIGVRFGVSVAVAFFLLILVWSKREDIKSLPGISYFLRLLRRRKFLRASLLNRGLGASNAGRLRASH
jgi:ABC-type Fe3+-siderophore transport system permease subunit